MTKKLQKFIATSSSMTFCNEISLTIETAGFLKNLLSSIHQCYHLTNSISLRYKESCGKMLDYYSIYYENTIIGDFTLDKSEHGCQGAVKILHHRKSEIRFSAIEQLFQFLCFNASCKIRDVQQTLMLNSNMINKLNEIYLRKDAKAKGDFSKMHNRNVYQIDDFVIEETCSFYSDYDTISLNSDELYFPHINTAKPVYHQLYRHFKKEFDRQLSFNIRGEKHILLSLPDLI